MSQHSLNMISFIICRMAVVVHDILQVFIMFYPPKLNYSSLCLELIGPHQLNLDGYILYISTLMYLCCVLKFYESVILMHIVQKIIIYRCLQTALPSQHATIFCSLKHTQSYSHTSAVHSLGLLSNNVIATFIQEVNLYDNITKQLWYQPHMNMCLHPPCRPQMWKHLSIL